MRVTVIMSTSEGDTLKEFNRVSAQFKSEGFFALQLGKEIKPLKAVNYPTGKAVDDRCELVFELVG